ncbi:phosphotransferase enzyme family protein [Pseudalkalibacillus caeni]|nr:phosphotransferase [Pseudalkalibacillus caeni]
MMKLSMMEKVVDTLDENWKSPIAEMILNRWEHTPGTVKYYRASANFLFIFKKGEDIYFLRINEASERTFYTVQSEIAILQDLNQYSLNVVQPIKSLDGNLVEEVQTEVGTFYAVVFKKLKGRHKELEDLAEEEFMRWGESLGNLHKAMKSVSEKHLHNRTNWKDQLAFIKETVVEHDPVTERELHLVSDWLESLHATKENYGLIHYDFELDNLCWTEDTINILDFDDCSGNWYVADIAYALRDLFKEEIELEHPSFKAFIKGYQIKTDIDYELLQQIEWFMRLHNLVTFAKLKRAVDGAPSHNKAEWLAGLSSKLMNVMDRYRTGFERTEKLT